jgi:transmembrane sensor
MRAEPAPIPRAVLAAAADWLLRLGEAPNDPAAQQACAQWCAQHPDHARAWQRAQQLQALLQQVPATLALPVLGRGADPARRAALKRLGLWLAVMPAGWLGWQLLSPSPTGPMERTAVGERRRVGLPDGSQLLLDTDTRVVVRFDDQQRGLRLERGRIRVESAPDPQSPARPLQVFTPHGRIRALGTRFDVRLDAELTHVSLIEGRLQISPHSGAPWLLEAGWQAAFDAHGAQRGERLDDTRTAWATGMLVADALPLGELLAELARYRRGALRCDPQVAALPVSGAFPLDDTAQSLAMLEATYPVRVQRAAGGLWTTVAAR